MVFYQSKNWFLASIQELQVKRLSNIGCVMTIAITWEVAFNPMLLWGMLQQPIDNVRIDTTYLAKCSVVILFGDCCCNSIKVGSKGRMFELLVKVIIQMLKAVTMRTTRKHIFDGLEETFLAVGNEGECLTSEIPRCMFIDNFTE